MNRGSIEVSVFRDAVRLRFNEAPIHESGKWRDAAPSVDGRSRCFNEAPIHESGKS